MLTPSNILPLASPTENFLPTLEYSSPIFFSDLSSTTYVEIP